MESPCAEQTEVGVWDYTMWQNQSVRDATVTVSGRRLHVYMLSRVQRFSLTYNRVFYKSLVRSFRESKVQCVIEDTWVSTAR